MGPHDFQQTQMGTKHCNRAQLRSGLFNHLNYNQQKYRNLYLSRMQRNEEDIDSILTTISKKNIVTYLITISSGVTGTAKVEDDGLQQFKQEKQHGEVDL